MIKGIIVLNQTLGHNEYKVRRFLEESDFLDISFDVVVNDGTLFSIVDGNIKTNLPKADFVIYLDKDIYLATALEKAGYVLYNGADFIRICDDKALTSVVCAQLGIDAPKTITPPLIYEDCISEKQADAFVDFVIKQFILPVVGKLSFSSLGKGVFLLKNKEEIKDFYSVNFNKPFAIQEFISASRSTSIRVIVIDEKVIGAIKRINEEDFRSNIGSNRSEMFELNEKCLTFARNIAEKLHIKYAGIDILLDENHNPKLCEINSNAFFEEFEKTTKINVAKLMLEYIKREVEREKKDE
jgi:ribosomal protein S6--L-glutamate ligase/gamma-F420-2:alpha-L-glutamate ligase